MELKSEGNQLYQQGRYEDAVNKYNQALDAGGLRGRGGREEASIHANLSLAHLKMGMATLAAKDAQATQRADPKWSRGYTREGEALAAMGRQAEAARAFQNALALDPNDQAARRATAVQSAPTQQGMPQHPRGPVHQGQPGPTPGYAPPGPQPGMDRKDAAQARDSYRNNWQTDLMRAPCNDCRFCCFAIFCSPCASFILRKRALYGDMERYTCCAGYMPCSGKVRASNMPREWKRLW
eukprot:scaffold738_cov340-Pavlova_lutheri.AAC.23